MSCDPVEKRRTSGWQQLAFAPNLKRQFTENVLRADGELDFAAARFHALEGIGEISEANLFGDEVEGQNVAAANGFHGLANEPRGVVEWRDELDLRVMNRRGFNLHARARRQSTEKIDHAAAAHHGQRLLPGGWIAGRFDNGVGAPMVIGQTLHRRDHVRNLRHIDGGNRTHALGDFERRQPPGQRDHANASARQHAHKFQSNRPQPMTTAVSPARTSISWMPRSTQASGSTSAALPSSTECGTSSMFSITMRPGMRMYSAYAPLLNSRSSQRFSWARRQ